MKQCNKCHQWKEESEFNKFKGGKNGLYPSCKKCKREYDKEKYKINGEEKCQKVRNYINSPLEYNSTTKIRKEIELYEEVKESKNSNIECKCTYCGGWFEPTKNQIKARLRDIDGREGREGSESRFYCSDKCKENCSIYGQYWHEKGYQPATSREVQPELRKLTFQRDDYTCQRCGNHRDNLEVGIHCHHIDGIQWNPLESADVYNCITLCEDCHNEVHGQKGCRYHELKCPSHLKYNL